MVQYGKDISKEPYGIELAKKVAEKLKAACQCCQSHKEYCGIGLFYDRNKNFFIARAYDGSAETRIPFFFKTKSEKAFVKFLAKQTDETMSGTASGSVFYEIEDFFKNNQRITKAILEEFIK